MWLKKHCGNQNDYQTTAEFKVTTTLVALERLLLEEMQRQGR